MSATTFDARTCDLCGSSRAELVLARDGRSFTSDSRVVPVALRKLACLDCGLIRNGIDLGEQFLDGHYRSDYTLGQAAAAAEPLVFTPSGPLARSEVIHAWMLSALRSAGLDAARLESVLEIGCGEGSVLERFSRAPGISAQGLEPNRASVAAARAKGLNVAAGGYADAAGSFDLVYAFAVIEHVPSPADFIATLKRRLKPGGVLLIAQPCQDRGSVDLFFCDHLHHFCSRHIAAYAARLGMHELFATNHHEHLRDFSLHVLGSGDRRAVGRDVVAYDSNVTEQVKRWRSVFAEIDRWLTAHAARRVVVWGVGQTFLLTCAYTRLGETRISLGIDDNARRAEASVAFPVVTSRTATQRLTEQDAVLFTFAPRSEQKALLGELRIPYFSFSL